MEWRDEMDLQADCESHALIVDRVLQNLRDVMDKLSPQSKARRVSPRPGGAEADEPGVLGIILDDDLTVMDMVRHSPAYNSLAIEVGDRLVSVAGVRVDNRTHSKEMVADLLKGRAKTAAALQLVSAAGVARDVVLHRISRDDIQQRHCHFDDALSEAASRDTLTSAGDIGVITPGLDAPPDFVACTERHQCLFAS